MRGADKLLEIIDGIPQIVRVTSAAIATGHPVILALPPDRPKRNSAVNKLQATVITVENRDKGMAASICAGVSHAVNASGLMILPADMPELTVEDLQTCLAEFYANPNAIIRATSATGIPGHPVVFPADLFPDLTQITGDEGARSVLKRHQNRLRAIPLPGNHAVTDLDTPEDWAAWRGSRTNP